MAPPLEAAPASAVPLGGRCRSERFKRPGKLWNPKKLDDVRDGSLFHIRVTVGYLTSLTTTEVSTSSSDACSASMVSAYASFGVSDDERGEYDCATSLPLSADLGRQNVKWPRGVDVKTSKRRLYHSVLLRSDGTTMAQNGTYDDDESTAIVLQSQYAAELINLQIGLKKGDETVSIGAATLVLTDLHVRNQQIDLPVQLSSTKENKKSDNTDDRSNNNKMFGIKKFFGAIKSKKEKLVRKRPTTFSNDNKKYSFEKNAVLRIKLDVMEGLYQTNGPGLWGDLEDDEESFGPIPVIDIPEECTNDFTDRYKHEAIEVCAFKQGTTIISSPGNGEAEESKLRSTAEHEEPTELDHFFAEPSNNREFQICGTEQDAVSEIHVTSSVTVADDGDSSSESSGEDTYLYSIPASRTKKSTSRGNTSNAETRTSKSRSRSTTSNAETRTSISRSSGPTTHAETRTSNSRLRGTTPYTETRTTARGFPVIKERYEDDDTAGDETRGGETYGDETDDGTAGEETHGGETYGDETDDDTERESSLEEVKAASSMLMRFAGKMGVNVEDLLDAAPDDDDSSDDGSSNAGSSRNGTTVNAGSTVYPGDRSNRSRSSRSNRSRSSHTDDHSRSTYDSERSPSFFSALSSRQYRR